MENCTQQNLSEETNSEIEKNNTRLKVNRLSLNLQKTNINDIPQKTKTYPKYKRCN